MRPRTKARETALQLLYGIELFKNYSSPQDNISEYFQSTRETEEIKSFSVVLVEGVCRNINGLNSIIKKYVKNWGIERIAVIDRNIIRIASFELLFLDDIPPKVSINEGVELAKRYGDIDSPRFVNGILDKIYKMEIKQK